MAGIIDKIAALGASAIISASALESACAARRQPVTTPEQVILYPSYSRPLVLPTSIQSKIDDLLKRYQKAIVYGCIKDNNTIFLVSVREGKLSQEVAFYTEKGDYIGSVTKTDANEPRPKLPVELEGYVCDAVSITNE